MFSCGRCNVKWRAPKPCSGCGNDSCPHCGFCRPCSEGRMQRRQKETRGAATSLPSDYDAIDDQSVLNGGY
jgi:hypothetical protein